MVTIGIACLEVGRELRAFKLSCMLQWSSKQLCPEAITGLFVNRQIGTYQRKIQTEDTWVTALTTELPERTYTNKVLNTFEACRDVEPLEIEKKPLGTIATYAQRRTEVEQFKLQL